jgi:DNA repair ATPase RecN
MKKIVKLTENDLTRIVKKVIKEQGSDEMELYTKMAQDHFENMSKRKSGGDDLEELQERFSEIANNVSNAIYDLKEYKKELDDLYEEVIYSTDDVDELPEPVSELASEIGYILDEVSSFTDKFN